MHLRLLRLVCPAWHTHLHAASDIVGRGNAMQLHVLSKFIRASEVAVKIVCVKIKCTYNIQNIKNKSNETKQPLHLEVNVVQDHARVEVCDGGYACNPS